MPDKEQIAKIITTKLKDAVEAFKREKAAHDDLEQQARTAYADFEKTPDGPSKKLVERQVRAFLRPLKTSKGILAQLRNAIKDYKAISQRLQVTAESLVSPDALAEFISISEISERPVLTEELNAHYDRIEKLMQALETADDDAKSGILDKIEELQNQWDQTLKQDQEDTDAFADKVSSQMQKLDSMSYKGAAWRNPDEGEESAEDMMARYDL